MSTAMRWTALESPIKMLSLYSKGLIGNATIDGYMIINNILCIEFFLNVSFRFQLDRLKAFCENMILSSLSVEVAASVFQAADIYHAEVSN